MRRYCNTLPKAFPKRSVAEAWEIKTKPVELYPLMKICIARPKIGQIQGISGFAYMCFDNSSAFEPALSFFMTAKATTRASWLQLTAEYQY
jgi:hypothetical protein